MPAKPWQDYYYPNRDAVLAKRRARFAAMSPEERSAYYKAEEARARKQSVFKHGISGYMRHKCRCDVCALAYKSWRATTASAPSTAEYLRQAKEAAIASNFVNITHGTGGSYRLGCRCALCKAAKSAESKAARANLSAEEHALKKRKEHARAKERAKLTGFAHLNHGSQRAYFLGCRCDLCKVAKASSRPRDRHKKGGEEASRVYLRKKERMASDPQFKVHSRLSGCFMMALKKQKATKSGRTAELLGCTMAEFMRHMESMFLPGMSWENRGSAWHIDHRLPCASFDLLDPEQQRACFHYTNLQPLWDEINTAKSDSITFDTSYAIAMTPYPS